jgi:uridylate kinase
VIRALECGFTWVLKATQVSGVFSEDPLTHSHAIYYPKISYEDVIGKKLCVMDPEAISLAQRHEVKIVVFRCDETIPSLWKIMTESDIPYTIIE